MTTDADGVATIRVELRWIDDRGLASCGDVALRVSMARFAGNARMQERQPAVVVERAWIALLHSAHVAAHTACLHGQRGRHLGDGLETGLHVVGSGWCIICDR